MSSKAQRFAFPLAIALLAACSNGGGGSIPSDAPSGGNSSSLSATGTVVDYNTGKAVAGAAVVISQHPYAGVTPPPPNAAPWAVTSASGSFTVRGLQQSAYGNWVWVYIDPNLAPEASPEWVDIFPSDGHVAYHGWLTIDQSGATKLGTIKIMKPARYQTQWLAQINADRAANGVHTPLVFDEGALEAAQNWVAYMGGNAWFGPTCPTGPGYGSCTSTWDAEIAAGIFPTTDNIAHDDPNWQSAEAAFMAQKANCPGGQWQTCPLSDSTGGFITIMSAWPWAGVAQDLSGKPGGTTTYYDQEFGGPPSNMLTAMR